MKKLVLSVVLLSMTVFVMAQDPVYSDTLLCKAESGNAEAMSDLGKCYDFGSGVKQNFYKAVLWYRRAANLGNAVAMNRLGFCYDFGNGVEQNDAEAIKWHHKAAELGNATAMLIMGYYYDSKGTFQNKLMAKEWFRRAIEGFRKAAETGDTKAMINIGFCYEYGKGVERNYFKAFNWWSRAAALGDARAMTNVGNCHYWGAGTERNQTKAVEWYLKAADGGNAEAMRNLGNCYSWGTGVLQDYLKAANWYHKSADIGNVEAMYLLGNLYYNGYGVEKDHFKAVRWYSNAAEWGNVKAMMILGKCYSSGDCVEKNQKKADLLFAAERAMNIGNKHSAMNFVAEALELYSFFEKDYVDERINRWRKRGDSEKMSEWRKRVNDSTFAAKAEELSIEAMDSYIDKYASNVKFKFSLLKYYSDRQLYVIRDLRFGDILLPVPAEEVSEFEKSWEKIKIFEPSYFVENDRLALKTLSFKTPGGKIYKYANKTLLP